MVLINLVRALVEHKITVSNLKRLIFGKGDKTTKQQDKSPKAEQNNTTAEEPAPTPSNEESHIPKGHGRLPHIAYINANEHTIPRLAPITHRGFDRTLFVWLASV